MYQHDDELEELRPAESLWFDALGFVPLTVLAAYLIGTWLPLLL